MTDAELVRHLFIYDEDDGVLRWGRPIAGGVRAGSVAGTIKDNGYVQTRFKGRTEYAHRLIWLYIHGAWPPSVLDHMDGNRKNNRISNLRLATVMENAQNQGKRSDNSSGYLGVSWCSFTKKWRATIWANKRRKCLGRFDTPELAYEAYLSAKEKLHEFQPVPRAA